MVIMVKILFYSNNKKTESLVSKLLKSNNYEFGVRSISDMEKHSNTPDRPGLEIFDMAGRDTSGKNFYNSINKNFIASVNKIVTTKLMIIHPGSLKSLLDAELNIDDFIFYPNIESELISRVEFLLIKNKKAVPKNSIIIDDMILNPDKYELTVNKKIIELTYKEFELLKMLLQNQDSVLTRDSLFSNVWDYDFYGGSRTVDVHIRRLRSKLPSPYNLMIKTIRNVGYLFSSPK